MNRLPANPSESDVLESYLRPLTSQIRYKKARGFVAEEITAHIKDQQEAYEEMGMEPCEALKESIRQMGDPIAVGVDMDRIHRPRPDWKLLGLIAIFSVLGLILQYANCRELLSAQATHPELSDLTSGFPGFSLFFFQCIHTVIGLGCMAVVYFTDYTVIGKYSRRLWWLYFAIIFLVVKYGPIINGGYPYLRIYAYLFAPLYAGILYQARQGTGKSLLFCLAHALCPLFLFTYAANTIRTAFSLGLVFLLMTMAAVCKGWFSVNRRKTILGLCLIPPLAGILCLITALRFGLLAAYQRARLLAFFQMIYDPEGISYISAAIHRIMEGWQIIGGSGEGFFGYFPGYHYDYIVTFLFTIWGILPGLLILTGYLLLFARIFRIILRQPNHLGMMVGLACGLSLANQTLCYIASNFGFVLYSQLSMPFLSYGRNTAIVTYTLMGLLLSIYRYKDIVNEPVIKKKEGLSQN